jgi:hypothetical protein
MLWSLALRTNETLIEAALKCGTHHANLRRPFPRQPQKHLDEWLATHAVAPEQIERVYLASGFFKKILEPPSPPHIAIVTTSGFEDWLGMNRPIVPEHFTLFPRRTQGWIDRDAIFGLTERTTAGGQVLRAPDITELEQLASKLELLSIRHVAINLLHSNANPANQQVATDFLRSRGLAVFVAGGEGQDLARLREAALRAGAAWHLNEEKNTDPVLTWLEAKSLLDRTWVATGSGALARLDASTAFDAIMAEAATLSMLGPTDQHYLHLDVDRFLFFPQRRPRAPSLNSSLGEFLLPHLEVQVCPVQPLSRIADGIQHVGLIDGECIRPDPGPMRFGRGRVLSALDVMGLRTELAEFPDTSQNQKIAENLLSLFRELMNKKSIGAADLADEANQTLASIIIGFVHEWAEEMVVGGALGPWLAAQNAQLGSPLTLRVAPPTPATDVLWSWGEGLRD